MNKIDARGYSCPEPVIMTQKAVAEGLPVTVLVDSMTPVKNISRFAANSGLTMKYQETADGDFEIVLSK